MALTVLSFRLFTSLITIYYLLITIY